MFNLPNLLTIANLFCGCLAIILIIHGEYQLTYFLFGLCLLLDLLDGLVARMLDITSELGKELDSLADVVSFGVLPGIALVEMLAFHSRQDFGSFTWPLFVGLLFVPVAALRLSKFNIDTRQKTDFLGLSTPAATIGILGMHMNTFWIINDGCWAFTQPTLAVILIVFVILCILMLSELPMISFKIDRTQKGRISKQLILSAGIVILAVILKTCALPFIILWYILFSILTLLFNKKM
jgi:CDP-diacylglycerol--serine O-phosphatidyltransferase